MKKAILLAISALWLGLAGCKEERGTTFAFTIPTEVVIPATTDVNLPINLLSPDMTTNTQAELEANRTAPNLVREIKLIRLEAVIKNPPQTTFDFLRSIRVYLSAEGLPEREIGQAIDIAADGSRSLLLNTEGDVNLKDYIVKPSIQLRVQTITRQILTSDTRIEILPRFEVRASLLK